MRAKLKPTTIPMQRNAEMGFDRKAIPGRNVASGKTREAPRGLHPSESMPVHTQYIDKSVEGFGRIALPIARRLRKTQDTNAAHGTVV